MISPSPSGASSGPPSFPGSISHRLRLAVIAFLLLLVAVGGVSSSLAWSILAIAQDIPQQSHHVEVTEEIQAIFHHLIREVERAAMRGALDRHADVEEMAARSSTMVAAFLDGHLRDERAFPEKAGEIALIRRLKALHDETQAATARIVADVAASASVAAADLAVLDRVAREVPALARGLGEVHRAKIRRLLADGVHRMKLILGAFAVFLVVGGACGAAGIRLFSRTVSAPLRRLASATQDIAEGDFEKRVSIGARDEIGRLSESFNHMLDTLQRREAELQASQAELRRRVEETHALCRIGVEVSSKLEIDAILDSVLEQARTLLQCQAGALCLLPAEGEAADPGAAGAAGNPGRRARGADLRCPGTRWPGLAPARVSRSACATEESAGPTLCLRTALRRGEEILGTLCVGRNEARGFQSEDRALLEGLAAQAAIAIENARLYRQVRSLAAVQERERIAREIHDGAAQGVAFLHLRLKTLEGRMARGGVPPSLAELADMRAVSKRTYADVRQSIFGLRSGAPRGAGLIPVLAKYLREFSRESGIHVEVQDGNPRATDFSPEVEVQLVRVIQEALNNVRKHARAQRAWVRFAVEEDMGCVTVEDDGIGFRLESVRGRHGRRFGLQTMRERTEAVGGRLEIVSNPRRGSRVVVRVPLQKPESAL
jgi:two-component system nitrate/nitrite sensor histidine kinase NarX